MTTLPLFPDLAPAEEPPPRTPSACPTFPGATATQRRAVAKGLHPMGHPMPGPEGARCFMCNHIVVNEMYGGKRFFKCDLSPQTAGPATDTRARWPACALFALHVLLGGVRCA